MEDKNIIPWSIACVMFIVAFVVSLVLIDELKNNKEGYYKGKFEATNALISPYLPASMHVPEGGPNGGN